MGYTKGEWIAWRFSKSHNWKVSRGDGPQTFIDLGLDGEADAHLIAASKDMYEAITNYLDNPRVGILELTRAASKAGNK